ncbi:hypothetical protein M1N21_00285 [Dehalococcoidia bacterium]|nr:hypothetical protein [Dehalococcoidia bacterium]
MSKKRVEEEVLLENQAEQEDEASEAEPRDERAIARCNIERALGERHTASAESYVQVYLGRGLLNEAEARGYLQEIHKQRYGGAV